MNKNTPRQILNAAVTGNVEKVRKLLAEGEYPLDAPELITAFRSACANNNIELAALFLDYGMDVNIEIERDWSALNVAIEELSLEVVQLLISRGADVNRKSENGQTPLHHSVDIEVQAAINSVDGKTIEPTGEIVKVLVESGADVNAKTNNGETPLDWARSLGNKPAKEILLNYQAA